jgi:3-isopropylmalate dehydrogenase
VIVTGKMFGDSLSDAAAMLTGSIGMLPSASLNASGQGLYEAVPGSAPDIAGRDIADPLAAILCAAMLLRHSGRQPAAADRVEEAGGRVLAEGLRTADIMEAGATQVGTEAMSDAVARDIARLAS